MEVGDVGHLGDGLPIIDAAGGGGGGGVRLGRRGCEEITGEHVMISPAFCVVAKHLIFTVCLPSEFLFGCVKGESGNLLLNIRVHRGRALGRSMIEGETRGQWPYRLASYGKYIMV